MLWITEVEMVDSLGEFKSSRSTAGKDFPYFELLNARHRPHTLIICQSPWYILRAPGVAQRRRHLPLKFSLGQPSWYVSGAPGGGTTSLRSAVGRNPRRCFPRRRHLQRCGRS